MGTIYTTLQFLSLFNSTTLLFATSGGSTAAVTGGSDTGVKNYQEKLTSSTFCRCRPPASQGQISEGAFNFPPRSLEAADHRTRAIGRDPVILPTTRKEEGDNDGGDGELGMDERKAPLLLPEKLLGHFYYATPRLGSKTEHPSARRGAHRETSDLGEWGRKMGLFLCFPPLHPQFFQTLPAPDLQG